MNLSISNPITSFASNLNGKFDIRLKENFKLFVSGPSRCGKTVFVSKLLENLENITKLLPETVLYIYKVWQPKYDEIKTSGVNFMVDSESIVDEIEPCVHVKPLCNL